MSLANAALAERIDTLQHELEPLQIASNEAVWQLNVTGEERWQEESARLETEIRTILSRPEPYRLLREAALAEGVEPSLHRQAVLLANEHAPNQIPRETIGRIVRLERSLEARFNAFRGEIDGERVSDNRIRELLEHSEDLELRRRAWEASKQIGAEVAPALVELVRLRNAAARDLGYASYYSMMLELDELDEAEVFSLLDRVLEGSQQPFERYKAELDARLAARFGISVHELAPWHYDDPFFQEAPAAGVDLDTWFETGGEEIVARYFDAVGFDVRPILARSDLYEREGKCQHAFCLDVDRRGEIRVLCNLRPDEYWTSTLLHELGHAVYDAGIDRTLPYFLRTHAHLVTTEASAMLFGRLTRSAAWLVRYAGMPAAEARAAEAALGEAQRAQRLHLARWVPVMAHFERSLYRDADHLSGRELNGLWWDLVERFQLLRRPASRDAHESAAADWAAKIHLSVSPAYYQNYLLGEITASQLQSHVLALLGGGNGDGERAWERYVASSGVGRFLTERLYRLGRSTDWRAAIEHATGRPLDPAPFLAELAGE